VGRSLPANGQGGFIVLVLSGPRLGPLIQQLVQEKEKEKEEEEEEGEGKEETRSRSRCCRTAGQELPTGSRMMDPLVTPPRLGKVHVPTRRVPAVLCLLLALRISAGYGSGCRTKFRSVRAATLSGGIHFRMRCWRRIAMVTPRAKSGVRCGLKDMNMHGMATCWMSRHRPRQDLEQAPSMVHISIVLWQLLQGLNRRCYCRRWSPRRAPAE